MKKIGILTFHNAYNYGAVLQCYALQKVIGNKNFNVEVINYNDFNVMDSYRFFPKNNRNLKSFIKSVIKVVLFYGKTKKRYNKFDEFIKNNYILSKNKYTKEDLLNEDSINYDCLITGSDQVWSISIVGELSDIYTLNFANDKINKISYAASVGDASTIKRNKNLFKNKISKINHISVREDDAKNELEKILTKPIEVVLDPTLLLKSVDWNNLTNTDDSKKEKYILAYVVQADEEYIKIVNDLSEKTGLKVIHFDKRNPGYKNVLKSAYTEGPLEFVNYIKNADYVVATSFHATVFSVIFNKKFFIVPHRKTGARVTNLLDKLGIEGRTFSSYNEFKDIDYNFDTNWDEVNKKLDIEREKSINWLLNAINDEKEEKNE